MYSNELQAAGRLLDSTLRDHVERLEARGGLRIPGGATPRPEHDVDYYRRRGLALRARFVRGALRAAWRSLGAAARRGLDAWALARRARHTRDELFGLDDRTLHDIGVSRSDIPYIAQAVGRGRAVHGRRLALRHPGADAARPASEAVTEPGGARAA